MTLNKTTRKEKFYQKLKNALLQANARKFSLFKQCNFFNGEGFLKIMSLRFTLMKALKSSIRLQIGDRLHFVNTCFYQVTKRVKWNNFAFRRKKSFFKMVQLRRFRSYNYKVYQLTTTTKKTKFFLSKVKILLNLWFNKIF